MKKLKFFFVALLCCMATGSAWAQAIGSTFVDEATGFTYEIKKKDTNDKQVSIIKFGAEWADKDVVIPKEVKEPTEGIVYQVTIVAIVTPQYDSTPKSVKSITIPEGVTTIERLPLTSIGPTLHIPSTVTSINTDMANASGFQQIDFAEFTVAEGNTTFYAEDGILFKKSAEAGKKELWAYPLANKKWLTTDDKGNSIMNVPEGVTHIPGDAISNNKLFQIFHLPKSLISMPTNTNNVRYWQNLRAYTVDAENPKYYAIDSVLCIKPTETEPATLLFFPKKKLGPNGETSFTYVVPNEITKVANYAFLDSKYITTLDLNNVEELA
ncbi:MAG: hypothetical protein HUJ90_08000, partial [Bacteroidales bacterium]|nr:hypothetical protein [Bacteroidales bacterium]